MGDPRLQGLAHPCPWILPDPCFGHKTQRGNWEAARHKQNSRVLTSPKPGKNTCECPVPTEICTWDFHSGFAAPLNAQASDQDPQPTDLPHPSCCISLVCSPASPRNAMPWDRGSVGCGTRGCCGAGDAAGAQPRECWQRVRVQGATHTHGSVRAIKRFRH